jgi:hypothetical protein
MAIVKVPNFGITSATSSIATSQTTSSTSYTDLSTAGPSVTLSTGTKALVIVSASIRMQTDGQTAFMSYAVSGATTVAASDTVSLQKQQVSNQNELIRASAASVATLTAGSNTFTAKYRSSAANTSTFVDRSIVVIDLGS